MSKSERADLQRLLRQREKVFKSAAKQRSAELLADFENQMGEEYSFDQDEVWEQAAKAAEHEIRKAQALISARCRDLGIPKQFAPDLGVSWRHGGGSNVLAARRAELRRMAQKEIELLSARRSPRLSSPALMRKESSHLPVSPRNWPRASSSGSRPSRS